MFTIFSRLGLLSWSGKITRFFSFLNLAEETNSARSAVIEPSHVSAVTGSVGGPRTVIFTGSNSGSNVEEIGVDGGTQEGCELKRALSFSHNAGSQFLSAVAVRLVMERVHQHAPWAQNFATVRPLT